MLTVSDFKYQKKRSYDLIGKIRVKVLVVAAIALVVLFFAQLVLAANLATDGQKLAAIGQEIRRLEAENTTLVTEIAQLSSLTNLSQKAASLGFVKPTKVITP